MITHQEAGTTDSGHDYSKALAVDRPGLGEPGWIPFRVTKEFRDALDSAFRSALEINPADYCLSHGYFTANSLDSRIRTEFVSPLGFATIHLLAILVRLQASLDFNKLKEFLVVFK